MSGARPPRRIASNLRWAALVFAGLSGCAGMGEVAPSPAVPGLPNEIGTVEMGRRADLPVLPADLAADIHNTRGIETAIRGTEVLRPEELLGGTADTLPSGTRLVPATEVVPLESVDRGIGVVAFAERADTVRIFRQPDATAAPIAIVVGPGSGYTLLADRGVRRNAAEIAYEELALPYDSVAGSWTRVVYGRSGAGEPLRGWVITGRSGVRTLRWAELLQRFGVYLPDDATPRFHASPGGAPLDLRLGSAGEDGAGYDLQPITVRGEWMQVRVTVPSVCSGDPPASQRVAWIRYLDPAGRPLLWSRTRGC
jgi:hypothetical protein